MCWRKDRQHAEAIRRLYCTVRGFLRGNNANNTNLSPLNVNGNNAPSNTNTNIGFGNYTPNDGSPSEIHKSLRQWTCC